MDKSHFRSDEMRFYPQSRPTGWTEAWERMVKRLREKVINNQQYYG